MKKQSSSSDSYNRKRLRRVLIVLAGLVLLLAVGAAAFVGYRNWRARDLAFKARENFESGSYRLAWLQINSARGMNDEDPEVLRSSAIIDSGLGMTSGLGFWEQLASAHKLTAEDLESRARSAARFGTDEQFERAVADLAATGDEVTTGRVRAARNTLRGDLDRAIEETRRLAEARDDSAVKMDVARLMFRRHVDRLANPAAPGSAEIAAQLTELVDSLMGTPQETEALAFGLAFLKPSPEKQVEWAERGMKELSPANIALLPAARTMVALGKSSPEDLYRKLRPVFDAAPLERRADFSIWLSNQNMPKEALTLVTAAEAAEGTDAFLARTQALAKMENWAGVIETADVNGNAPADIRFAARARAEYALGRGAQSGAKSVADALRASARAGRFAALAADFDDMGAQDAVDAALLAFCADSRLASTSFRFARDRFSRRGAAGSALLASSYDKAKAVAPDGVSVKDYGRYLLLIQDVASNGIVAVGQTRGPDAVVSPAETAQAILEAPADEALRATHALALIQAGRGSESFGAFDDVTIYFNRLSPPIQAVLVASATASGQSAIANEMRSKVDAGPLSPPERALLGLSPVP